MWSVDVPRAQVLAVVKVNRDKHKAIVAEALEAYRKAVIEELEKRIDTIKSGKAINIYIRLPEPEDHTDEYDTIIGMLEMTESENVTLGSVEYRSYVEDKWDWKDRWVSSTASYASSYEQ